MMEVGTPFGQAGRIAGLMWALHSHAYGNLRPPSLQGPWGQPLRPAQLPMRNYCLDIQTMHSLCNHHV